VSQCLSWPTLRLRVRRFVDAQVALHLMQQACNAILSAITRASPSLYHYMTPSRPYARAYSATANRPPTLPRLPVPDLHQTLSKYLRSLVPLLQEDEARGGPAWRSTLQERQLWADEFEKGLGAKCQERLHGKSAK